jgi:transposase
MQYPIGSKQFKKENGLLRKSLAGFEEDVKEELKTSGLHHERKKVLNSLRNHWSGLMVFLDHPHIPMDNNRSERTLRNPALGRKNYYGSQTAWSGQFTAAMLSIFESLQLWKINQQQWLTGYLNACAVGGGVPPTPHREKRSLSR